MGTLKKLTPKQEQLMYEVRDEWLGRMFKERLADREGIKKGVELLYELSSLEKPQVIIVDSPMGALIVANLLKTYTKLNKASSQVRDQVWDQVWDQVRDQVRDQVGDQVWVQVRDQVDSQVRDQVWDQVWDQVGVQVGVQVRDQVRDQVDGQKIEYFSFCHYGSITDYGWNAFYDFFTRTGVINDDNFNNFSSLIKSGVYDMLQFEKLCIVSILPDTIYRDPQGRLHNPEAMAIEWKDGYGQHYLYGVYIEPDLFALWKKGMTTQDILKIENQEQKSALLRAQGYDSILDTMEHRILDEYTYKEGITERIVEVDLQDEPDGTWARFIQCNCWSTNRPYMLRVDPRDDDTKTVIGAQAWLAGKNKKEFAFGLQT